MNFQTELEKKVSEIEGIIQGFLPKEEGLQAAPMAQAMNYSMRGGGKRLRPLLLMETCRLFGGRGEIGGAFCGGDRDDPHPFADPRRPSCHRQ